MQTEQKRAPGRTSWAFLTNHFEVLLCIYRDPEVRLRDVAAMVGITERAAQAIVADLVAEGYLSRSRVGRRNHYDLHLEQPLRHSNGVRHSIGDLLGALSRLDTAQREGERLAAAKAGPTAPAGTAGVLAGAVANGSANGHNGG